MTRPERDDFRRLLLTAASEELERSVDELAGELDEQGDFAIGSQKALGVIAVLERSLNRRLNGVDELEPEDATSFETILDALWLQMEDEL